MLKRSGLTLMSLISFALLSGCAHHVSAGHSVLVSFQAQSKRKGLIVFSNQADRSLALQIEPHCDCLEIAPGQLVIEGGARKTISVSLTDPKTTFPAIDYPVAFKTDSKKSPYLFVYVDKTNSFDVKLDEDF